jgi:hypothetical protein
MRAANCAKRKRNRCIRVCKAVFDPGDAAVLNGFATFQRK